MPSTSTHINFARLVLEKSRIYFDPTYFILGNIAPDSATANISDVKFRLFHFMLTESGPDLNFYLEITSPFRQKSHTSERSFIDGYYTHLWLDNFMKSYTDDLMYISQPNLSVSEAKAKFNANVEYYNLVAIKDFVKNIKDPAERLRVMPGMEFVSYDAILKLWNKFLAEFSSFKDDGPSPVIIAKELYLRFLLKAADELIKLFIASH
jgi:hypothetical protein